MEKCGKKFPAALKSQVVLGKHLDFISLPWMCNWFTVVIEGTELLLIHVLWPFIEGMVLLILMRLIKLVWHKKNKKTQFIGLN